MSSIVKLTKRALKDLIKVPRHILVQFDLWVEIIETEGYAEMQKIKGYRDHQLIGNRMGQRSSSLSKSWRVIYCTEKDTNSIVVEVLEVNHHDY
ncbi:MAG: type II toxin-antitoxin system mRNA interferase toxin, RelE/StbE family [Bacteriovoracaceae bacterium]